MIMGMSKSRARYLTDQLLSNSLTRDEFDELLRSMGREQMSEEYSDLLERHFYKLLNENDSTQEKHKD